jgi:large subunit ribosomal protein L17
MRHRKATRKLARPRNQRRALIKGLVRSLLTQEKIRTTLDRAKAAEMLAEKLITSAKQDTVHARRQVRRHIAVQDRLAGGAGREKRLSQNEELVKKIFTEIAPRMKDRQGGYTRLTRVDRRRGDGATMAVLELVGEE